MYATKILNPDTINVEGYLDTILKTTNGGETVGIIHNETNIPDKYNLYQNYPNPFNPNTTIKYELPKDVMVSIKIYDILGGEIKTLVNDFQRAGQYSINFNGSSLASGICFYRIKTGDFVSVKRMMLIK